MSVLINNDVWNRYGSTNFNINTAEKLHVWPGGQRVKTTEVNRAGVKCQTTGVNLWLPGEKLNLKTTKKTFGASLF